jgi:DNA gyrase subunit B
VKDDAGLNSYLIQMALDKAQLQTDENAPIIQGLGLEKLAQEFTDVMLVINRLARRYDAMFLEQLTYIEVVSDTVQQDQSRFAAWLETLQQRLNQEGSGAVFSLDLDYGNAHDYTITVDKRLHGNSKVFILQPSFFNSLDYKKIAQYATDTNGLFSDSAFIRMGERQQPVANFKQAFEWMMKEVKKGQQIQRYKGLGEMNPEQLWETTLDSNNRRLLQVTIEDAIATDEIFTTLMGDVVEPRRDFIVKNALDVANLDV